MKKFISILMIVMLLFLTGCGKEQVKAGVSPFIGGQVGLTGEFSEGAPPDEVYDKSSSSFAIGLKLTNVGENEIQPGDGYVEIVGINPRDFGLITQADLIKDLTAMRSAKKNVDGTEIEGDSSFIEFGGLSYSPDLKGNTDFKFRANLCYNYKTQTSTKICVNRDVIGGPGESICGVSEDKTPENSGGPIHLTKVKESPLGDNKIQLLLEVEQTGDADDMFYKLDTVCNNAITNSNKYKVFVDVTYDIDGVKPVCTGLEGGNEYSGYLTMFSGQKRSFTCIVDLAEVDSVFEDLFTLDLSYRYHQYFEKEIEIRDIG